jgi:hypothetical protein
MAAREFIRSHPRPLWNKGTCDLVICGEDYSTGGRGKGEGSDSLERCALTSVLSQRKRKQKLETLNPDY